MLKAGDQIGSYILTSCLGQGRLGVVWLAEKRSKLETTEFALKFILDNRPNIPALQQEIKLWKKLSSHPNITSFIEADIHDDYIVIVSEYVQEGSLQNWFDKITPSDLSVELAIKFTLDILSGLEYLHSNSTIHSNLKPANILIQNQIAKLTDFGLSKVLKTKVTETIEDYLYICPENFDTEMSEQSDLWAAAAIFYQLLSGKTPFAEKTVPELINAIRINQPNPLPNYVPKSIRKFVSTALEKDPSKRYPAATAMREALLIAAKTTKPKQASKLMPGDQLGSYKLVTILGKGNFGTVWLAEKEGKFATTKAALKVLNENSEYQNITKEAQVWVKIGYHTNVVSIIEADIYDNIPVIASEYVTDGSLKEWLIKHNNKAPSIERAVSMIDGILAGLEHLHSMEIIHRDLKPGNILLQGETPKIADFGLSRSLNADNSVTVAGTPIYMAPESFEGERSKSADIWSIAVIFYNMLTGQLPFYRNSKEALIKAICIEDPPSLPEYIPYSIAEFVYKSLQKDPTKRFLSVTEMRTALKEAFEKQSLPKPISEDEEETITFLPKPVLQTAITEIVSKPIPELNTEEITRPFLQETEPSAPVDLKKELIAKLITRFGKFPLLMLGLALILLLLAVALLSYPNVILLTVEFIVIVAVIVLLVAIYLY